MAPFNLRLVRIVFLPILFFSGSLTVFSQNEPNINFGADVTVICPGGQVIFSNSTFNLFYPTSYFWDFGAGATPATASGWGPHTVTYSGPGSSTVSLRVTVPEIGYDGTAIKADYITVRPITTLTLISGPGTNIQAVCENAPITEISYAVGGWPGLGVVNFGPSGIPGGNIWADVGVINISGNPMYAGIYNYQVTAEGFCGTETASGTITVYATPVISDYEVLYVCAGSQKQLSGTGSPAAANPWISGNLSVATIDDNGLVTGISEGTSVITYADSHGCSTTSLLTVKPLPPAPVAGSNSPAPGGGTIWLATGGIENATYSWTGPDNYASDQQYLALAPATNAMEGTYSVKATVNGCEGPAGTTEVVVNFPPVVTEGESLIVNCDEENTPVSFALTLHVTDEDGDPVQWIINRPPYTGTAGISGTGTARTISYSPPKDFYGSDSFEITVSDSYESKDNITVNVYVNPVNDPPVVIAPVSDQVFNEKFINGSIDISGVFSDPDYDQLTFTGAASSNETVVTASIVGQTLWLTAAGMGQSLVTITVTDGTVSAEDQFIVVIRPDDIEQSITLTTGWNILSFGAQPEDMSIRNIADPLIIANVLTKVQDEEGKAVERLSESVGWINEIGDISATEGYRIRVTGETNLSITGQPVTLPLDIPLEAGWNIIGYPSVTPDWSANIFAQLIQEGTLVKVQDEAGNAIEKIGDDWIYGITMLEQGKGYSVKVNSYTVLTIGQGAKGEVIKRENEKREPMHFRPAYIGNGLDHMNIYLGMGEEGLRTQDARLREGNEIGVFDGDICVGSAVIENDGKYIQVKASFEDPETVEKDGFTEGNTLVLRLWNRESGEETDLRETEPLEGYSLAFERQGTTVLKRKIQGEAVSWLGDAYPNPSRDRTTFTFGLAGESRVKLEIIDIVGNTVAIVIDEAMPGGIHRVEWDNTTATGEKAKNGLYLYRFTCKGLISVKQLVIN